MNFAQAVKEIRQDCFLSQQAFANELGIAFSTVNRWEKGRALPNYQTMKRLVAYCKGMDMDSAELEAAWKESKSAAE